MTRKKRYHSRKFRFVQACCLLVTGWLAAGQLSAAVVADSVTEFSGVQGQDNWYYGYYPNFGGGSFQQLPYFDSNGSVDLGPWWELTPSQPSWALLWADGGHPGWSQWVVRRWISEVDGTVNISGEIQDDNLNGPGYVTTRIRVDGVEYLTRTVGLSDPGPYLYSIDVPVNLGSTVDFIIDPAGDESYDGTTFTARISAVPVPAAVWLFISGVAGLSLVGRRAADGSA